MGDGYFGVKDGFDLFLLYSKMNRMIISKSCLYTVQSAS